MKKSTKKILINGIVAILVLIFITTQNSFAITNYVGTEGSQIGNYFTVIQKAIDNTLEGGVVIVSNGVYSSGGTNMPGFSSSNRIVITSKITVRSVSGPANTTILGSGPLGEEAVRCAYLSNGGLLSGFTLSNGFTADDYNLEGCGGGAFISDAVLSNCVVFGNSAKNNGGGIYCSQSGSVYFSTIKNNVSENDGGGAYCSQTSSVYFSTIENNICENGGGGICCDTFSELYFSEINNNISDYGGGIFSKNSSKVYNCSIRFNTSGSGGGMSCGEKSQTYNCWINKNKANGYYGGGGIYGQGFSVKIINCTITENSADYKGGGLQTSWFGTLCENSIIYYNYSPVNPNYTYGEQWSSVLLENCCTTPIDCGTNFEEPPQLAGINNPHIVATSPCRNSGTNGVAAGVDIDKETRIIEGQVDVGCDEFINSGITGKLSANIIAEATNVAINALVTFYSDVIGKANSVSWSTGENNKSKIELSWAAAGDYEIILSANNNSMSAAATVSVHVTSLSTNYVLSGAGNSPPYTDWANAAENLADAVNAACWGGVTMIGDGVYNISEEIILDKNITITSLNSAEKTIVCGGFPAITNRCFQLNHPDALLHNITVSNGFVALTEDFGGGVLLRSYGKVLGCIIIGNHAKVCGGGVAFVAGGEISNSVIKCNSAFYGGGVYLREGGIVRDSIINENSADISGGGAYFYHLGQLINCRILNNSSYEGGGTYFMNGGKVSKSFMIENQAVDGGGAFIYTGGIVDRCLLASNSASSAGGGVGCSTYGDVNNSVIFNNDADQGGGAYGYTDSTPWRGLSLKNSTVYENTANKGGGVFCYNYGEFYNSIIYSNYANIGNNDYYNEADYYGPGDPNNPPDMEYENCCITDLSGLTNFEGYSISRNCISSNPEMTDPNGKNFKLLSSSPCINSGYTPFAAKPKDYDGYARVQYENVDIGAHEFTTSAYIYVSETILDFCTIMIDETNYRSLVVENLGDGTLDGEVTEIVSPFGVESIATYSLSPLSSTKLDFIFAPTAIGKTNIIIKLTGGGNTNILLEGAAIPEPFLFINFYLSIIIYYKRKFSIDFLGRL